jgi:predicted Zn-dependent peptidase
VVGPVDTLEARGFLVGRLNAEPIPVTPPPALEPAQEPVRQEFGSITAWVTAAYPFGRDADVEGLRLLASIVSDRFAFGPSSRQLYDARGEVVRHAEGGEVRFTLVVPPGEAEQWGERLRAAVASMAETPLYPTLFNERLRRYRGERLMSMDLPEDRARVLARELLLTGRRTSEPIVALGGLTPERVQRAAQSLQAPVMVYLGPFENKEQ